MKLALFVIMEFDWGDLSAPYRAEIERRKLIQKEKEDAINPDTLARQIGMTLAERAADLSRKYESVKFHPDLLRILYRKNMVRKK